MVMIYKVIIVETILIIGIILGVFYFTRKDKIVVQEVRIQPLDSNSLNTEVILLKIDQQHRTTDSIKQLILRLNNQINNNNNKLQDEVKLLYSRDINYLDSIIFLGTGYIRH